MVKCFPNSLADPCATACSETTGGYQGRSTSCCLWGRNGRCPHCGMWYGPGGDLQVVRDLRRLRSLLPWHRRSNGNESLVMKRGRRRRNYVNGQTPPTKQRAGKAKQRMSKPIIGTGARGNISVYATKFIPDLNTETLSNYLKEKLGWDVNCQRIDTMNYRYS